MYAILYYTLRCYATLHYTLLHLEYTIQNMTVHPTIFAAVCCRLLGLLALINECRYYYYNSVIVQMPDRVC